MDRDKLKEARSKFIRENRPRVNNEAPLIAEAFDACADAIMAMPLSDRLTDAEKDDLDYLQKCRSYVANWSKAIECKKCGNLNPRGYICATCGWDNSCEPNED